MTLSAVDPNAQLETARALPLQVRQAVHALPSPQKPELQAHWEVSDVDPAVQLAVWVPLAEQILHCWQLKPLPNQPALHWHWTVSEVDPYAHPRICVAT